MRQNLVGIAMLFAELAGRYLVWNQVLEGWDMVESQVANRWRAQGDLRTTRALLIRLLFAENLKQPQPDEVGE
jgi:hypothetical protein